jgi:sugar phosphate isomerase/epimerase
MRIGVVEGPVPHDIDLVTERLGGKLLELGFTGIFAHFGYDGSAAEPEDLDRAKCAHARDLLAAYGVRVAQSWTWDVNFIHPDKDVRTRDLVRLRGAAEVARALGADGMTSGGGSHNPRGIFWPHPDNHTAATQARLVESLREAARIVEDNGIAIGLEPHVMTTLDSAERIRDILDAVGSPSIRVNLDPVNLVPDLPTLWASTELVEHVLDVLAPYAITGHVKDAYAEDRLVVHVSETFPGDGCFDIRTYLRRFEEALPDAYMFIEHLPEELVPRAKLHVDSVLAELSIEVRTGV